VADCGECGVAHSSVGDTGRMSVSAGGGRGPSGSGLRGVLFDSGDVLMRPTSPSEAPAAEAWRRWFGGPRFVATVHAHLPGLRLDGADRAFDAGMRYLDARHHRPLRTVAEERQRFTGFYRIVLQALGVPDPAPALLQELVGGNDDEVGMEPFPEVVGVLERLRDRGLRLGVLTENWPSVETAYQRLGLRGLFHAFVISAQEARLKDDPELFAIAAARMGLPAEAMLFVDDWPPHVQTALGVGFRGAVLDRHGDAPVVAGLTYLTDLQEVERLTASATPHGRRTPGVGGRWVL
jgi:FMN phosphatase YigB (HAD superfamily)